MDASFFLRRRGGLGSERRRLPLIGTALFWGGASGRFVERRVFVARRNAALFFAFFFLVLAYFLVYFLANGGARRYNEKRKVCDALPNLKKNSNERTAKRRRPTTARVVATLSVAATSG